MGRPARPKPIEVWMYVKEPAKLRRRRMDKHMTQVQLAALVGVTQQYISALEKGNDRDCSQRVADKLCRWLDVAQEDYFDQRAASRMPRITTASRVSGTTAA